MILLLIMIKVLSFMLFAFLSVFTLLYGKHKTGIKPMYFITSLFLLGVILSH